MRARPIFSLTIRFPGGARAAHAGGSALLGAGMPRRHQGAGLGYRQRAGSRTGRGRRFPPGSAWFGPRVRKRSGLNRVRSRAREGLGFNGLRSARRRLRRGGIRAGPGRRLGDGHVRPLDSAMAGWGMVRAPGARVLSGYAACRGPDNHAAEGRRSSARHQLTVSAAASASGVGVSPSSDSVWPDSSTNGSSN